MRNRLGAWSVIFAGGAFAAASPPPGGVDANLPNANPTAIVDSAVFGQPVAQPPVLPDGRENPAVNRFGLDAATLSRGPVQCTILRGPAFGVRGVHNTQTWPGGFVPYEFDANVSAANQAAMLAAMAEIEAICAVDFVVRNGQPDYLHIQNAAENSSFVGRQGGSQPVNIVNWNFRFIMCHELMHALGIYHEQSRPDRASFVTINTGNIQSGQAHNFAVEAAGIAVGTYDFDSVMQYDGCAFSTCCPAGQSCACATACLTIQALPAYAQLQSAMGQRTHLSAGDRATLLAMYDCAPAGVVWVDFANSGAQDGSFAHPYRTLASALSVAPVCATIRFRSAGVSSERPTINQRITIEATAGPVTIGQ